MPTRRTRCATPDRDTNVKERERERESEMVKEWERKRKRGERGGGAGDFSCNYYLYGSVAGTLDERSRSIELPGSPSLCLTDSISLAFRSPTTVTTLADLYTLLLQRDEG